MVAGCAMIALAQERTPDLARHAAEHMGAVPSIDDALLVGEASTKDLPGAVTPGELNFGIVGTSCTAFGQAYIWNRGKDPIEILDVVVGCGCTKIEGFEPGMLASGDVVTIDVYMTAPEEAGVEKTRYVLIKIKGQPTLKLPVKIQTDGLDC